MQQIISALKLPMSETLTVALIGVLTVFLVLAVLVGLLLLFQQVFKIKLPAKKNTQVGQQTTDDGDEETVAAIMAAVTLMMSEEQGENIAPVPFRIRSVKRIDR